MIYCSILVTPEESDFDENGEIRTSRILHFYELAAGVHVEELGIGPDDLIKDDRMWVLSKVKVQYMTDENGETCKKAFAPGKSIKVVTYPVSQKSVTFRREFCILPGDSDYPINPAEDGSWVEGMQRPLKEDALLIGSSQWTILNFKTRKIERTNYDFRTTEGEHELIEGRFEKIHGGNLKYVGDFVVSEVDIDRNMHMNNSHYIEIAQLASGRRVEEYAYVNFAKETRAGDRILMYEEEQEEGLYVEGRLGSEEGETVFQTIFR